MEAYEPVLQGILASLKRIEQLLENQQKSPNQLDQKTGRGELNQPSKYQNPGNDESGNPINDALKIYWIRGR
jgi:hypothetical protein